MKIYKQAVLIPNDHGYLEVISYYDLPSGKFGLDFFLDDKLIERIEILDEEPTRDEMRYFGTKLTVRDTPGWKPGRKPGWNKNCMNESNYMKSED